MKALEITHQGTVTTLRLNCQVEGCTAALFIASELPAVARSFLKTRYRDGQLELPADAVIRCPAHLENTDVQDQVPQLRG